MELDDLKSSWKDVNTQAVKKTILTPVMIDQITRAKYQSHLKKITYPEIIGVFICVIGAAFIGLNFSRLYTIFLQGMGILSIFLLLLLPVMSMLSLQRLHMPGDVNKPYAETLREFAVQKMRFYKFQRVNMTLSYLLLVTIIILLPKLFGRKGITDNYYIWTLSFSLGYIFLLFFSKFVSRNYNKALRQAEDLLKELES
jgi:hypothetical protein